MSLLVSPAAPQAVGAASIPGPKSFTLVPGQAATLSYSGATLEIGADAVSAPITITIQPLSDTDVAPGDEGMANTTLGPQRGYRFLPHNTHFLTTIRLTIPYDKKLVPSGLTDQDINTFFLDDQSGSWQQLQRLSVDPVAGTVSSLTDHFTDMINATVTVPDHPQPLSYNPNALKNIQAGNPGAAVTLIEPPQANSKGDARLSFPIEVPPGRAGMQPQLELSYNSSNGNGWVGLGWELAVPAVGVETRWGVPRYDSVKETETYTLTGEQLTPVAHRGVPVDRSAEKAFHTRVETQFQKIIRHGTGPANYTWEATDKNGVRSFFGGYPDTGPDVNATLKDASGNIFRWALIEMRDPHANGVRFTYDLVSDVGLAGGSVAGSQLYLKSINYTQSNGSAGAYSVTFSRDSELPNYTRRPDVQIDARGGFKMVTAELLKRIDVTFNGQPVRSYDLQYQEGAFKKTLLTSITQRGDDGSVLPPHEFTYFDDIRSTPTTYNGFASQESWNTGSDKVDWTTKTGSPADALAGPLADFLGFGGASAVSGSVGDTIGGHVYVGFNPDAPTKQTSAGAKVGFNYSDNDTLLLLLDINGDHLPDKVFKNSTGEPYFRLNKSGPNGVTTFGDATPINTLTTLSKESSFTFSFGAEAYFFVNGLVNDAETFTTGSVYFTDVNGDGLPDLVNNGTVLFNHLDNNGVPTFTTNSAESPVTIPPLSVDPKGIVEDLGPVYEKAVDTFPLQDSLRRWVAPFDGTVRITGDFHLAQDTSPARAQYPTADGVRVAIQRNGTELFSQAIAATDYSPKIPQNVESVAVKAGDRIYFRVGSVFDGKFDQVTWDPVITYQGVPSTLDVNKLDVYAYKGSTDFTLAGRRGISVQVPFDGTLRLAGALNKSGVTTDDVTVVVLKNDQQVFSDTKAWNQAGAFGLPADFTVAKNDVIKLRVKVDSPIDLGQLQWNPDLFYVAVTGPQGEVGNVQVTDSHGNYLIQLNPPYDVDLYPNSNLNAPQQPYVVTQDGTLTLETLLQANDPQANGVVTFTIKKPGALLAKRALPVVNGLVSNVKVSVNVSQGDVLFFDYSAYDPDLATKLTNVAVQASFGDPGNDPTFGVPSALHSATFPGVFPQPYRGWAVAGYNGNRDRANQPVIESDLNIQFDKQSSYDPRTAKAYLYYPVPDNSFWRGPDDLGYISKDTISSSRLGVDFISVPKPDTIAGAQAVSRLSRTSQHAVGAGVSVGPLGATGSTAQGTSYSEVDYVDMNGDEFPDVIGNGHIQYTTPLGGLESSNRQVGGVSRVRETSTDASNLGVGGSAAFSKSGADGEVDTTGNGAPREEKTGGQMVTLGLGGSLGKGDSSEQFDLLDVNGDGLPDRVTRNGAAATCGTPLCVAFNLGYGFAPFEPWGSAPVGDGASQNFTLSGSLGFNGGIYDFAGGLSLDKNASQGGCTSVTVSGDCGTATESLLDVNGDGLPDRVKANGTSLRVAFNTGNGFASEVDWNGAAADGVARTGNTGLGGGVYFTIGIGPLCLVACYLIVNPGADFARNLARMEAVIRDVDGDGYPDHLVSTSDGSLQVARNQTGKTNLLKSVKRPLGATMHFDFQRTGNTYDLPQSRWVLARVDLTDGLAGDGVDTLVKTYRYEGGLYNRLEREFYGFARVSEEHRDASKADALYRVVVHDYRTDSYYTKGLERREITQDAAGKRFLETEHSYTFRDVESGIEPADPSTLLQSTTATVFPELAQTDRRFYEGLAAPGKTTFITNKYDAVGNVIELVDAGDSGPQDDLRATFDYSQSLGACVANYIVGKPTKIAITDSGGGLLRRREASIDCGNGNITQVRSFLANGVAATTDLTYFGTGNLQSVQNPENLHAARSSETYEYDSTVQTHITKVTDNLGYVSTATYNLKFGAIDTDTDINQNKTTHIYDAFGRLASVTGPYEQGGTPTIRFEYHPEAAPPWALTRHLDPFRDPSGSDTIDTVLFTDGLKRVVQTKKDATIYTGADTPAQDVVIVSGRVTFDFVGRTVQQRYPVTEPLAAKTTFSAAVDPVQPTLTEYDIVDRVTKLTIPDGTHTTTTYGFGPDRSGASQFQTTVADANGVQKKTYRDVRDLITSVKEFNNSGSQEIWTSYGYDPLKQITEVRDDKNNLTKVVYDTLGRRTAIDNPDTGLTETQYDLASNVTGKITANLRTQGRQVSYDYDALNRLTAIKYPNFPDTNVAYTYGGPQAAANSAGTITLVNDQSGSEQRSYGKLGEITKEIRTVVGFTGASPFTYITQYVTDSFGRVQNLTYPDGEVLTYRYDSGGLVRGATGQKGGFTYPYINRVEYDKFDQRAFVEDGNGVRTLYSYNTDNRRLANLTAGKPGTTPFQNLKYTYDKVGNVLGLVNDVPLPAPSAFGGPTHQSFTYDDLYRLTSSKGTFQFGPGKTNQYSLGMSYDTIHNIVSKTQTNDIVQPGGVAVSQHKTTYDFGYAYQAKQPHATSHIDNRTFTFDSDGNQTGWTNDLNGTRRTIVWDDENRAQSIFDNGHEKQYKYDDHGDRVIKRGPQGETVYVNQYFTIRNGTIGTKHVYAATTRIASKLMKSNVFEKDQYYYHADHLGSSNYVTDLSGSPYEHLEYFPFGETWVQEATNTQRTPYLFTSKEEDEETDLYYYGARYFDPRTSTWQSADPAIETYLPRSEFRNEAPAKLAAGGEESAGDELKTLGGIFNSLNLNAFGYSHQNPVKFTDPDGRKIAFAPHSTNTFKHQFAQISLYLKHGHAAGILVELEKRPETIFIKESKNKNVFEYDPNTHTITFHPRAGLRVSKGRVQTPALGFLHEAGHALQDLKKPAQLQKDAAAALPGYGTKEEKRVIEKIENPAATKLHEPLRHSHGGTVVIVRCSTCRH